MINYYNHIRLIKTKELIQFKSEIFNLTNNILNKKIFIGLFGNYELIFYSWDNYGNREEYKYLINLNDVNIDFEIFNSSEIIENKNPQMHTNAIVKYTQVYDFYIPY